MNPIVKKIQNSGIIPLIPSAMLEYAPDIAAALQKGGIPIVEIACNDTQAISAIRAVAAKCPEMLIGAGQVFSRELADMAVGAGASFITTLGVNSHFIDYCLEMGHLIIASCSTLSDIEIAFAAGVSVFNIFPTGIDADELITLAASAYSETDFIISGGINASNIANRLSLDHVLACRVEMSAPAGQKTKEDFSNITEAAEELVKNVLGFEIAHVGINCEEYEEASNSAKFLCDLFGFAHLPGPISVFSGTVAEFMVPPYRGKNGHIGFFTNSVPRAMVHLAAKGMKFIPETMRYTESGKLRFVYLETELCGFALHLSQKP